MNPDRRCLVNIGTQRQIDFTVASRLEMRTLYESFFDGRHTARATNKRIGGIKSESFPIGVITQGQDRSRQRFTTSN